MIHMLNLSFPIEYNVSGWYVKKVTIKPEFHHEKRFKDILWIYPWANLSFTQNASESFFEC